MTDPREAAVRVAPGGWLVGLLAAIDCAAVACAVATCLAALAR